MQDFELQSEMCVHGRPHTFNPHAFMEAGPIARETMAMVGNQLSDARRRT